MRSTAPSPPRSAAATFATDAPRLRAALLAGAIELAAIWALIEGLAAGRAAPERSALAAIFTAAPTPAPTPSPPPPRRVNAVREGRAAPAGARSSAAPILAAPSPLPSLAIAAAVAPGMGAASRGGAAQFGQGTGAGGMGNGTGSGGNGDGAGDGGFDAELIGGRITDDDYPDAAKTARAQGITETEIFVDPHGKASGCKVRRSSGNAALDATTCRLALKRFRFRPARDAEGHPAPGSVYYDQQWEIGRIDDDPGP